MGENIGEDCGVVAIYSKKGADVAPLLVNALFTLQHRGQDAAGIAVSDGKEIRVKKGLGLVNFVFNDGVDAIVGHKGIGHVRYPTEGTTTINDVQPLFDGYGNAIAHNGHIANYCDFMKERGYSFNSSSDSEVFLEHLKNGKSIKRGVKELMEVLEGSFSVVALIDHRMVAFRDSMAIRPLVWGENEEFVCIASETTALDVNNIPFKGDIKGGEFAIVEDGKLSRYQLVAESPFYCIFEYIYFARPDSTINGKTVYLVREEFGRTLADIAPVDADVVVPVPDTSRPAANAFAERLGIPYREGLIKNRYSSRTFIMPTQEMREEAVRLKLNAIQDILRGKRVVLFDDSIVRGTTIEGIVRMVRNAGAREVHLRITCPPIIGPCFRGVNMKTHEELIANLLSVEEMGKVFGVDSISFLPLKELKRSLGLNICAECIGGDYLSKYVEMLAKKKKRAERVRDARIRLMEKVGRR